MAAPKKRKPGRPSAESAEPKTELQLKRWSAMAAARGGRGITQQMIKEHAQIKYGADVSQSSIGAVLRDKYDHEVVQRSFCDLTETELREMWPGTAAERRAGAAELESKTAAE